MLIDMKKLFFTIIGVVAVFYVFAQSPPKKYHKAYLKETLGVGTHLMIGLSLHFIHKKNFTVAVQGFWETRTASTLPKDQSPDSYLVFPPSNDLYTIGILLGKIIESKSKLVRYDIRGGINFGQMKRPINFRPITPAPPPSGPSQVPQPIAFGVKYHHDVEKKTIIGIVINPTIQFTFSKIIGLSLGVRSNINHQDITAGIEAGLMIGLIR